uniref:Uncharacterized protein n=1 Tax=viral metagenome TaxID=1070528 RepID=A0A6C0DB39_9ZZZZ
MQNGGFPPIKLNKLESNEKNINNKERLFSSTLQSNINIRQILLNNQNKKLIQETKVEDKLEIVTSI